MESFSSKWVVVLNFTAFIFNTSLTKKFHSKLKRPNCYWRVVVLPATSAATAMATMQPVFICDMCWANELLFVSVAIIGSLTSSYTFQSI